MQDLKVQSMNSSLAWEQLQEKESQDHMSQGHKNQVQVEVLSPYTPKMTQLLARV